MAQLGIDVDALEAVSAQMTDASGQIESLAAALTGSLEGVWWEGTDGVRFKDTWNGTYRTQLTTIVAALVEASTNAQTEATQQREASN